MSLLRPGICKAMTENVWSVLLNAEIRTVTEFVVKDPEEIARTCDIAYKDVLSIRRVLLAQYSGFPVTASQLYANALTCLSILSTGISSLDQLLDGGLYAGELCEVVGEAAVGKTQICLRCAATVAGVHSQNVVYIDTCASFSAERLLDFIPGMDDSDESLQKAKENLSRIHSARASDVFTLFDVLDNLVSNLKRKTSFFLGVKLLVIDSVASVIYPVLGGKQIHSLALLEQLGLWLKQLAMDFSLAVLVSNNMTSGSEGEKRPSLGRLWSHVPHTRITLEREAKNPTQGSQRKATLVKSMRLRTESSVTFDLACMQTG